jgi:glyoxylase-like metal-dependent hydrolase (beta-lactamase superfamily II)
MKRYPVIAAMLLLAMCTFAQKNTYEVYGLKFATNGKVPVSAVAVGAVSKDSVQICYMLWALKGSAGKTILVDAGFTDTVSMRLSGYVRPDQALAKINIQPADVSDIILTHPHTDHLNGIDLFPAAMIWMQRDDYNYFVGAAWQKGGATTGFKKSDVSKLVQRNLDKKLTLVHGDNLEIIPGIRVFIGSKHTYESQFLLVSTNSGDVVIASDNSWFYYNLLNDLPIPMTFDSKGYIQNLKRMKSMVKNPDLIIPGHDPLVFSKFPKVVEGVVRIGK